MVTKGNPYIPVVLSLMPRVITNLDRDPCSPTYGSFDRNYWHLKIRNFSSAVLQQAVLILAICYKNSFDQNVYYGNEQLKQWITASLEYWAKIQNRDGSYDEYWKGEGSFPATAFSTYAATEAYLLLDLDNPRLLKAIKQAIGFLAKRTEKFALNQEIAASAAVYNMHLITKEARYLQLSEEKIKNLKTLQTDDGFFPEHGGADIGYSSVALEYLSVLYEKSGREDIKNMCNALIYFLSYFIHPDGTTGGHYGSRNTEYFMLGGLESCLNFNPLCAAMLEPLATGIAHNQYVAMGIDERYLLHFIGYSLARALINYQPRVKKELLPYERNTRKFFPNANLYVFSNTSVYLIISLSKAGVFRLYAGGRLLIEDTGYRIIEGKKIFLIEVGNSFRYEIRKDGLGIIKNFYEKKYASITPLRSFLLVLYSLLFGNIFWNFFRKYFISGARKTDILLKRDFIIDTDKIIIKDEVNNSPRAQLIKNPKVSIKNVPSSKFFQIQQLENQAVMMRYDIQGSLCLKTLIDLKTRQIQESVL